MSCFGAAHSFFYSVFQIRIELEAGLSQHLLCDILVVAAQSDNHGSFRVFFHKLDEGSGHFIASGNAAEDVEEDDVDIGVVVDQLKSGQSFLLV